MTKALAAYFSSSGVTAALAKRLAGAVGADLFEIKPDTPYTKADLDWTNAKCRSSVEMNDKAFRPPVASRVPDMAQYDTVFVGFPIWWYVAPTIIWRIFDEEKKLAAGLPGYCEYMSRVKYRLLPLIW